MRPIPIAFLLLLCVTFLSRAQEPVAYPPPAEVRGAFVKLLERPKVDADVKITRTTADEKNGVTEEVLTFASEKKADGSIERVPALVIKPAGKSGRLPTVIVSHGTGSNKESQRALLVELAAKGIIGVGIDARYHGARIQGAKGVAYNEAVVKAWHAKPGEPHEYPFFFDTCWDLWRTIDYLQTRADVDPQRIGMMGISMGGIETYLAASVDERVKVIVPAIAVQSFRWSLENDAWQGRANTIKVAHEKVAADLGEAKINARVCRELWNKVLPGMLDQFDCPSMLRLCAGRSMLILSSDNDPNCPLGGAKIAFASAEAAYEQAGASERLRINVASKVGHAVTNAQRQAAVAWFAEKL